MTFEKIQDITVEVRGLLATFLNYGDLKVQTASEDSRDFMMKNASRPEIVRQRIFEMHNAAKNRLQPQGQTGQPHQAHASQEP